MSNISFKSEKDLEDLIYQNLYDDPDCLFKKGIDELEFCNVPERKIELLGTKFLRQVSIPPYGILDILVLNDLCIYDENKQPLTSYTDAIVIELKNVPVGLQEIEQISRYITCLKRAELFGEVTGVLIGPSVSEGHYTLNVLDSEICLYTFDIDLKGIEFTKQSGFYKKDEPFDFTNVVRDLIDKKINETYE